MRKLLMFNMVTLDGFFEGPNRELNWHNVSGNFNDFAEEQLKSVDCLIFGRVTYQLMESYWTKEEAIENDSIIANLMNSIPKIVISRTLKEAVWNNSRLIKNSVNAELMKLKEQNGKDMIIFGSAVLVESLWKSKIIDEYRIMVNPVILGKGNPLFRNSERTNLKLIKSKEFDSGNVLLYYENAG